MNNQEAIDTIKQIRVEQVALAESDSNSYNAGARDIAWKIGQELLAQSFPSNNQPVTKTRRKDHEEHYGDGT